MDMSNKCYSEWKLFSTHSCTLNDSILMRNFSHILQVWLNCFELRCDLHFELCFPGTECLKQKVSWSYFLCQIRFYTKPLEVSCMCSIYCRTASLLLACQDKFYFFAYIRIEITFNIILCASGRSCTMEVYMNVNIKNINTFQSSLCDFLSPLLDYTANNIFSFTCLRHFHIFIQNVHKA